MKAQRWEKRIALLFFNLDARWGWVVNVTPRSPLPREREPVSIVQEVGCPSGPVWTGAEELLYIDVI